MSYLCSVCFGNARFLQIGKPFSPLRSQEGIPKTCEKNFYFFLSFLGDGNGLCISAWFGTVYAAFFSVRKGRYRGFGLQLSRVAMGDIWLLYTVLLLMTLQSCPSISYFLYPVKCLIFL